MGRSGSGKTSMRSVIFANFLARETGRLNPTLDVQHSSVRFLGSLVLNLWDCGGQQRFYEDYFTSKRDTIFPDVAVLIYVFDAVSAEMETDLRNYDTVMEALAHYSPGAQVFVLVHKMDLVPEELRDSKFAEQSAIITAHTRGFPLQLFRTSIFDETLYKAWSSIVYAMIPNIRTLESHLATFTELCDADEVVLFERATFLVVSSCSRKPHADVHRFERVSNIVKQFKLACMCVYADRQHSPSVHARPHTPTISPLPPQEGEGVIRWVEGG